MASRADAYSGQNQLGRLEALMLPTSTIRVAWPHPNAIWIPLSENVVTYLWVGSRGKKSSMSIASSA